MTSETTSVKSATTSEPKSKPIEECKKVTRSSSTTGRTIDALVEVNKIETTDALLKVESAKIEITPDSEVALPSTVMETKDPVTPFISTMSETDSKVASNKEGKPVSSQAVPTSPNLLDVHTLSNNPITPIISTTTEGSNTIPSVPVITEFSIADTNYLAHQNLTAVNISIEPQQSAESHTTSQIIKTNKTETTSATEELTHSSETTPSNKDDETKLPTESLSNITSAVVTTDNKILEESAKAESITLPATATVMSIGATKSAELFLEQKSEVGMEPGDKDAKISSTIDSKPVLTTTESVQIEEKPKDVDKPIQDNSSDDKLTDLLAVLQTTTTESAEKSEKVNDEKLKTSTSTVDQTAIPTTSTILDASNEFKAETLTTRSPSLTTTPGTMSPQDSSAIAQIDQANIGGPKVIPTENNDSRSISSKTDGSSKKQKKNQQNQGKKDKQKGNQNSKDKVAMTEETSLKENLNESKHAESSPYSPENLGLLGLNF